MGLGAQLLEGTLYLSISTVFHALVLAYTVSRIKLNRDRSGLPLTNMRLVAILLLLLVVIALAHTVQVWLWAWALHTRDALQDWNTAVYFALVTYTTVGYGDVVLSPETRIFAAMAGVTGILNFGISTAFLVAALTRLFGVLHE